MAPTVATLHELFEEIPLGSWVAICEQQNQVVAFGADAQAVLNEAEQKGVRHPLIVRAIDQSLAMFL